MIDLTPDYSEKVLHIALRDSRGKNDDNLLVYNPTKVYSKINEISEGMYEEFFKSGIEATVIPIRTRQGPGEFVGGLVKQFNIDVPTWTVGGIASSVKITREQMKKIIQDLRNNPRKYFASEEEKEFGGRKFVVA